MVLATFQTHKAKLPLNTSTLKIPFFYFEKHVMTRNIIMARAAFLSLFRKGEEIEFSLEYDFCQYFEEIEGSENDKIAFFEGG